MFLYRTASPAIVQAVAAIALPLYYQKNNGVQRARQRRRNVETTALFSREKPPLPKMGAKHIKNE
jgi:hypothetical protein